MKKLLLAFLIGGIIVPLHGQSLFNVDGVIAIGENAVLTVSESFVNDGRIVNDGRLIVGQDWQNNGEYDSESSGDIVLNGEDEQFINHNAQTFQRVTISGGDKIFEADLTINETITFTDGKLFSQNDARLIVGPGATVAGGNETSYVVGPLYISSGEDRFYPIGTEDLYLPVTLTELVDTSSVLGIQAVTGMASNILDNTIDEINPDYYWQTDLLSGSTSGAFLEVEFRELNFVNSIENLQIAVTDDLSNQFEEVPVDLRSGDADLGQISTATKVIGPFYVLARVFGPEDRPPVNVLNLVTPNGDGMNDFLEIENITAYPGSLVTLFNRVGQKIYEATDYDNLNVRFDGSSNLKDGFDAPEGTYFYVITEDGEELASGFFEILR